MSTDPSQEGHTVAREAEALGARLSAVRDRMRRAAERGGRDPGGVEILPVTKGHPVTLLPAVAECGFTRVGENRVGEAEGKLDRVGRLGLRWHMVGHLQRNKADRAVRVFDELESLDSLRLARRLERELEKAERDGFPVLVQVNSSGEESKGGFDAVDPSSGALLEDVREVCSHSRLRVRGIMTMAPLTDDEAILRETFRKAREVFERCGDRVDGFEARTLSMGMSNDFEVAVEEGSTRVRLGTVLLGERPTS